jgi:cell division protein FtsW (lipid II flippase)
VRKGLIVAGEVLVSGAILATGVLFHRVPVHGLLEGLAVRTGAQVVPAEVLGRAAASVPWYLVGGLSMLVARVVSGMRRGGHVPAPLLLPALLSLWTLGWYLQLGYGDPRPGGLWPGLDFARGIAAGGIAGAAVLLWPGDPFELLSRSRGALLAGTLGIFAALALFGSGPAGSGVRINLGPVQPIEVAKIGLVAYLAIYLGERAGKLRFQRTRAAFLRLPRASLLVPALLAVLGLYGGLFAVGDLGPTLVLAFVLLGLFYLVTRSPGLVLAALGLMAILLVALRVDPSLSASKTVILRLQMWASPWTNGLPNGDQLATARWALAAGGWFGQGLGHGIPLPAGHTDLVAAHLGEELGAFGWAVYLVALGALVLQGLAVGAANRTPERALLAGGLALLLAGQWVVIAGGTLGLIPLTGIVVPFLSFGKSGMVAFSVAVALLGKMAEGGLVRAETDELVQIRLASRVVAVLLVLVFAAYDVVAWTEAVPLGRATSLRGVITTLDDGTVAQIHDPRLVAIARQIPRGEIRDRNGLVLAGNGPGGERTHPLGNALGTLLGPSSAEVLRPQWSLERVFEERLRGWGDRSDGPSAWVVADPGHAAGKASEKLLFVVPSRQERPRDRTRALKAARQVGADPASVRLLPLPAPDLAPLRDLLEKPFSERQTLVRAIAGDRDLRSVRLTLDSRLQAETARILARAAARGVAAAAVVLDVGSGEVLARAQVPDYDPSDPSWKTRLFQQDPRFVGVYGAWPDKTGVRGVWQSGSVGKIFTALVLARQGPSHEGGACAIRGGLTFGCLAHDAEGPMFSRLGWSKPIHDFLGDPNHGVIDVTEALSRSCNVWFGQLGLALGPEAFRSAVADGLEVGWPGAHFDPGKAGSRQLASTAFGQGALAFNVSQAARMVAVVGDGGVYRHCPSTLQKGAPCAEKLLVADADGLQLVLAGMRKVVDEGTARGLRRLDGVRIYGKTGTADSPGLKEEVPFGFEARATDLPPHSWFVAIAEPSNTQPCALRAPHRLAVAIVVPRGGTGAGTAGPAALDIIAAAKRLGWLGG